jgi:hypothetical protein
MYQGKRSFTQDSWKIQIESMKWGLKSKVRERSRTENSSRSFDRKSSRIGLPFDYGDSVRELSVHGCLHFKLVLMTFLYVNQIPVTDFIVLVTNFIVGLPTLLLLDTTHVKGK